MKRTAQIFGIGAAVALLGSVSWAIAAGKIGTPKDTGPTLASPYRWKNVAIVGGGFVTGIVTHPKEKGLMYARTDVGGAYRWNDWEQRWIPLTDEFGPTDWNFTGIESLAIDPNDPNKVYAAVGTYTNSWAGNGAILRSTDRGNTWKRTDLSFKNGGNEDGRFAGERLAVDPNRPSHLIFGTRNEGLWTSEDSGATWKKSSSFPVTGRTNGIGIVFIAFDKVSRVVYAGVSSPETGLYRSKDSGKTWEAIPGSPKGLLVNHGVLASEGALYLTYGDAPGPNGMSSGAVWKLATKTGQWTDVTPVHPGGGDNFGYGGVAVDAAHPATVMVTTMDRWARHDTIFRSADSGKTWKDIGPKSERDSTLSPYLKWGREKADLGHWIGDIEIDPFDPDHVLYVTGATIWASRDATQADHDQPTHWFVGANGLEETVVNDVLSPSSGAPLLSAVWDIDGFRHEDVAISPPSGFYQPAHGQTTGIDFAEKNPQVVARVFGGGGAYSLDNGATWIGFASKPTDRDSGTIAVSADGKTFLWTPNDSGTYYSTDRGATWKASANLPARLRVIADRVDASTFYAFDGNATIYTSKDSGATFTSVKAEGLSSGKGYLRAVPGHTGDLWLAQEGEGLSHSEDGGTHFTRVNSIQEANKVGFGKEAPGRDYPAIFITGKAEGTVGFFRSDDGGKTFVRINDDRHGFHYINAITGDPRVYGRVYLATGGRGILMGDLEQKR